MIGHGEKEECHLQAILPGGAGRTHPPGREDPGKVPAIAIATSEVGFSLTGKKGAKCRPLTMPFCGIM